MMALYASWNELGDLFPECHHLLPHPIKSWNIGKVPIDDLSKILSHCLAKFGPISPLNVLCIQTFSTSLLFNGWRSHGLAKSTDYVLGPKCITHQRYFHERQQLGGAYKEFLMVLFETLELPMSLAGVVSMSPAKRSPAFSSVGNSIGSYFGVTIKKPKGDSKEVG
jgi:hypothetical protein